MGKWMVLAAACGVFLCLPAVVDARSSQAVASLQGEVLTADTVTTSPVQCSSSGNASFSFSVSGVAAGPYPGTFTETGTVRTSATGPDRVSAKFDIVSGATHVTGTKQVVLPGGQGACSSTPPAACSGDAAAITDYKATITGPDGTKRESGSTLLAVGTQLGGCAAGTTSFLEFFLFTTTEGKATGGGQVGDASFGFNAKGGSSAKGSCEWHDRSNAVRIHCDEIVSYTQLGNTAIAVGRGTENGVPVQVQITVQDNGEPGRNRDLFLIQTSSGYGNGGVITDGNVQVH